MSNKFDALGAFRLDGDVAVVTGAASGIGAAIAMGFVQAGANVVIADLDDSAAAQAAERINRATGRDVAEALGFDVRSEQSVVSGLDGVVARHGHLDVLVNNAGTAIRQASVDLPIADWQKVLDVNMTGVFLCAREVVKRYPDASTRTAPRIINMASIMGLSGGGLYANPSYQATKGAVVNMTRAMAVEWATLGVRVNAIAPTWVRTPFIAGLLDDRDLVDRLEAMTPLGELAEPEDIVGAAIFLASGASRMVTGHTLAVDGGFLAQ
ncbi:MAG: SDR family oxidoreductase [Gammaproteobacteria bacterium]|nr:SDR family oxidoreductase [Gammaproteobacteria bacterium]